MQESVGERSERYSSALADISRSAITAAEVASIFSRIDEWMRSMLGERFRAADIFDRSGALQETALLRDLSAEGRRFVEDVAAILKLLAQQRERDRRVFADMQARFVRLFQNSPVALSISSLGERRLLDVNERWLSMFGYRRDEVIGKTFAELDIVVEEDRLQSIVTHAREAGILRDYEIRTRTKSGKVIDILTSGVPIEEGTDLWMAALVEITDRKAAEAERDQLLSREQVARAEAEHAFEQLRAVYAITDTTAPHSSLTDLLGEVLRRLRRALQIDHASVFLLEDGGKMLSLRAVEGPNPGGPVPVVRIPVGVGVSGVVAVTGKPMIVNDYKAVDSSRIQFDDRVELDGTSSVMVAPFRIGDQVAGVLVVSTRQPRQFTEEELRLLLLGADRVGPAIERGRLIDRVRAGMARQRALSRKLLSAQEEERRRLAVELHDELGQVLTAVKINLESLDQAKTTAATMAATIQSVDDALLRVRDMALDLRPSVLDDLGLAAAIRWYADRFARGRPVETNLSIDVLPALEPGVATACFRVAQEALTNVDRHARARNVWIDLHVLDGALELSVRDDGIGFDVGAARARAMAGSSVGLLGMQERVSLVDGEYEVVRVPTGGTEVRARFPLTGSR